MKNLYATLILAAFSIGAAPQAFAAEDAKMKSCLAMVKKMVGVEPTDTVKKLCAEGKSKKAMQAAMMGE